MRTTNYHETLIEIAEDCPVTVGQEPPRNGEKQTVASRQFDMIYAAPYRFTSDDVIFTVHADRAGLPERERPAERERFFSKGRACLRSSPLVKRYGWGIHSDAKGRVALVPAGSEEYRLLQADSGVRKVKAMRSKRA